MSAIHRVAVIFDDEQRPDTTGGYCLRALRELTEVEHIRPATLDRLTPGKFDLYLRIDDGLEYAMPADLSPSAYWAIDTHMDFDSKLTNSRGRDLVFAAQKDGARRLREAGIACAAWLPLACDPAIHRMHRVEKRYDVCFVGNVLPGPRADLLGRLRERYARFSASRQYFDEMARTYSSAKIVFNQSVKNDVNMRVFEALACGSLLVTNDLSDNGLDELFGSGLHLVTYTDTRDLFDKIDFYLADGDARERIAAKGQAEVLAKHTYRHRIQTILAAVERGFGEQPAVHSPVAAPGCDARSTAGIPPCDRNAKVQAADKVTSNSPGLETGTAELVALVPTSARRVLDIRCGAGQAGAAIKASRPAVVWGIERDEGAALAASQRLDRVLAGDVELLDLSPDDLPFDCIICGDVIEHMRRPQALLRKLRSWLSSDGLLIASVPNVRHHSVVTSLLEGNWTYDTAGLPNQSHVRFFMKSSIARIFEGAGLQITQWGYTSTDEFDDWEKMGQPTKLQIGGLQLECRTADDAAEFLVHKHLVCARLSTRDHSVLELAGTGAQSPC